MAITQFRCKLVMNDKNVFSTRKFRIFWSHLKGLAMTKNCRPLGLLSLPLIGIWAGNIVTGKKQIVTERKSSWPFILSSDRASRYFESCFGFVHYIWGLYPQKCNYKKSGEKNRERYYRYIHTGNRYVIQFQDRSVARHWLLCVVRVKYVHVPMVQYFVLLNIYRTQIWPHKEDVYCIFNCFLSCFYSLTTYI